MLTYPYTFRSVMKTIILIGTMFVAMNCFAQGNLSERETIANHHIDLTKEQIYFVIHGLVELDGHTFLSDTCSDPFMFFADADGIKICRKENVAEYKHRRCGVKDCPILHLTVNVIVLPQTQWQQWKNPLQLNGAITIPRVIEDGIK